MLDYYKTQVLTRSGAVRENWTVGELYTFYSGGNVTVEQTVFRCNR